MTYDGTNFRQCEAALETAPLTKESCIMEILWELVVNGNAVVGGAALTSIKIRRDSDGCFYDWSDDTFKNAGWTNLTAPLE